MIIDCHGHLYRDNLEDRNCCFVGEPFGELPLERFAEHARAQPVDRMILSVFHDTKTAEGLKSANQRTVEAVEAYPGFFSGLCAVNPLLVEESLECIEQHVVQGPLLGLGYRGSRLRLWNGGPLLRCRCLHRSWLLLRRH